ncbi:MAG: hypothetical protein F6K31_04350 [Symploca sp. SIO2G7]|nr:hypothetical protein [Symploca sp. SIO2G7]
MKWLVTFHKDMTVNSLQEHLEQWNCYLPEGASLIPLGESEAVIEIEGPRELSQLVSSSDLDIKVYPNSKVETFSMNNF